MRVIDKLVEQLDSKDQVEAFQAQQSLIQMVLTAGRPGGEKDRAGIAAALADHLTATKEEKDRKGKPITLPRHSANVRIQMAQWISYVAGKAEVPALKQALNDLDTREVARRALELIPDDIATKALIDAAVDGIGSEFRIGAINSLARRGGPEATAALKRCATDPNVEVRLAAVEALAAHPDPALDAVIAAAVSSGEERAEPRALARVSRARIRLAETLIAAGRKNAGKQVYQAILASHVDEPQKKVARAALRQLS